MKGLMEVRSLHFMKRRMLRQRLAAYAQGVLEAGLVMASGWRVTGLEQIRPEEGA